MNIQMLALAFLAATAIGGLAWVFIYPLLSGEKKAENRRASVARPEPAARQVEKSQRSRRITHITEVMGMEGDTIITQDLFLYDMVGEDANGNIIGRHRSTGIGRPRFWDRARYYGEEKRLAAALDAAEVAAEV